MPGRNKNSKHQLDVASKNNKVTKKAKSNVLVPVPAEFQLLDRYWKASNYLSVGQVRYADPINFVFSLSRIFHVCRSIAWTKIPCTDESSNYLM